MRIAAATAIVAVLYVLHQDIWFWRDARLVFGVLPIGLFYHAAFTVVTSLALVVLVRLLWPSDLDESADNAEALSHKQ